MRIFKGWLEDRQGTSLAALREELKVVRVFAGLESPPERHPGPISCRMADGLYIQADGSMPCYCSAGITRILGKIDGGDVMRSTADPS